MRQRRSGSRLSRTWRPIAPTRSTVLSARTPAALITWWRAGVRAAAAPRARGPRGGAPRGLDPGGGGGVGGAGEAPRGGVDVGGADGGVAEGDAQGRVGHQQGVNLLPQAAGGAGAQHPPLAEGRL